MEMLSFNQRESLDVKEKQKNDAISGHNSFYILQMSSLQTKKTPRRLFLHLTLICLHIAAVVGLLENLSLKKCKFCTIKMPPECIAQISRCVYFSWNFGLNSSHLVRGFFFHGIYLEIESRFGFFK